MLDNSKALKVLFKSRFDLIYFGSLIIGWMFLFYTSSKSSYEDINAVMSGFFIATYFIIGYRFSFEEEHLYQYYLLKVLGRKMSYENIYCIEFRDRSAPFERPIIVVHLSERTVGQNWCIFRYFYISRLDAEKVKAIVESKGVRWIVNK